MGITYTRIQKSVGPHLWSRVGASGARGMAARVRTGAGGQTVLGVPAWAPSLQPWRSSCTHIIHMAPLRMVHVGVGGRGTWPVELIAAQRRSAEPQFVSVAFVDISPDALSDAREMSGLGDDACFSSLGDALSTVESDVVMIVTSPGSHTALCMEAVRANKHLLVEKPFTKSLAESVQIMDAADAAGVKVMVCQNDRFRSGADTLAAPPPVAHSDNPILD